METLRGATRGSGDDGADAAVLAFTSQGDCWAKSVVLYGSMPIA